MFGNNLTPVVKNLILINVGFYILSIFLAYQYGINLADILGLHYINSPNFEPYQIFTHMFMHAFLDPQGIVFRHLFFNMFALFMFGPALENIWGPKRFLIYYLVCGLGAAFLYSTVVFVELKQVETAKDNFISNPTVNNLLDFIKKADLHGNNSDISYYEAHSQNPSVILNAKKEVIQEFNRKINVPMIGASGAIFGVLLGFGMLFPNTVLMLLFPPIPIKAKYFVAIYGLLELYAGVHHSSGDTVAHFAHIGGMIFGYLMIVYWRKKRDNFY